MYVEVSQALFFEVFNAERAIFEVDLWKLALVIESHKTAATEFHQFGFAINVYAMIVKRNCIWKR